MPDPAEITGATVIRLLAVAEVVRPLGACLSEKHQNHCEKVRVSILSCYTYEQDNKISSALT